MLERLKVLQTELTTRQSQASGEYKALFGDRARMVGNWIEDLEQGWPLDTEYASTCATEFEKMCGLDPRLAEGMTSGEVLLLRPHEIEHVSALRAAGSDESEFHKAFAALEQDHSVSVASVAEAYCGQAQEHADRAAGLGAIESHFYHGRREGSQDLQNGGPRR